MLNQKPKYINYNGDFLFENDLFITKENRSFRYGDGLFESLLVSGTKAPFIKLHYQRLTQSMEVLQMLPHIRFNLENLEQIIQKLCNKNKYLKGARFRISVFRNLGGLYTPETNYTDFLVESIPLPDYLFKLNEKGLRLGTFKTHLKSIDELGSLKSANALLYIMAGIYKKQNRFDDCLIFNQHNRICETVSSNIFLVKNNSLYTPSLEEGCISGIMRTVVIRIAPRFGFEVNQNCSLTEEDIEKADEIFVTNAVQGIQWVVAYKNRRYFNTSARLFTDKINEVYIPA